MLAIGDELIAGNANPEITIGPSSASGPTCAASEIPDAIAFVPAILSIRDNEQDPLAKSRGPKPPRQP